MPVTPHLVSGRVFDIYGNILEGASVSLTHKTRGSLSAVLTGSDGKYVLNLSKLDSQWVTGESITLIASKTAEGTKIVTTTISGPGGQIVDITLAETSDWVYDILVQDRTFLNMVIPLHYDGEKVTRSRPLPVSSSEIDLLNNPATSWVITRGDGQPNSETVVIRGDTYTRTFTYTNDIMTARSAWVKQ